MNLTKRQQEIALDNHVKAGLPVPVCPECGEREAHWVAETLERGGFFECDGDV